MTAAFKLRVTVGKDRVVQLPYEVPEGSVELIVLVGEPPDPESERRRLEQIAADRRAFAGSWRGLIEMADDFNAEDPEIVALFERGSGYGSDDSK